MIREILLGLVFPTVLFSQSLRLSESVASLPLFDYPQLARLARIQGHVELRINVKDGKVTSIAPPEGEKAFRFPQLSIPALALAKKIEFTPSATGECILHLIYRLGVPAYESKSRITIEPQENVIVIEANPGKADSSHAPSS